MFNIGELYGCNDERSVRSFVVIEQLNTNKLGVIWLPANQADFIDHEDIKQLDVDFIEKLPDNIFAWCVDTYKAQLPNIRDAQNTYHRRLQHCIQSLSCPETTDHR